MKTYKLTKEKHLRDALQADRSRQISSLCHPPDSDDDIVGVGEGVYRADIKCGQYAILCNFEVYVAVGNNGEVFFNSDGLKSNIALDIITNFIPPGWNVDPRTWTITAPSGVSFPFVDGITITESGDLLESSFKVGDDEISVAKDLFDTWPRRAKYYVEHVLDAWATLDIEDLRQMNQASDPGNIKDIIGGLDICYSLVSLACESHNETLSDVIANRKTARMNLKRFMSNYANASLGLPCEVK